LNGRLRLVLAASTTSATFSAAGDYVLQLSATDGALTASDELDVHVYAPPVTVAPPPVQTGWPVTVTVGTLFPSAPTAVDMDGDGKQELIVVAGASASNGADQMKVWIYDAQGRVRTGWPQQLRGIAGLHPVVGDLDGDGRRELFVGGHAWNLNGQAVAGWPQTLPGCTDAGAPFALQVSAMADLDGDGDLEVLGLLADGHRDAANACYVGNRVYVWTGTGVPLPGFPVEIPQTTDGIQHMGFLSVGDLDGDDDLEVIALAGSDRLLSGRAVDRVFAWHHTGQVVTGWPKDVPGLTTLGGINNPAVGDLDGDGRDEIILVADDTQPRVHVWHGDGLPMSGWPKELSDPASFDAAFPAAVLGDLTGDGRPEILVTRARDELNAQPAVQLEVFRADGTMLTGWPQTADGLFPPSSVNGTAQRYHASQFPVPAIADVTGDGRPEVIGIFELTSAQQRSPYVLAWQADGRPAAGFPFKLTDAPEASGVLVSDVDGDGDPELGTITHYFPARTTVAVHLWDLAARTTRVDWPMYAHDAQRTFRYAMTSPSTNQPPVLAPIGAKTVAIGAPLAFTVEATDPDTGDTLTFAATGLPDGATFTAATRAFSWTPTAAQAGAHSATFTVEDGQGGSDSETITITVDGQAGDPVMRITQPAAGAQLPTSTVEVRYEVDGDRTGVDHVHVQLDDQAEVRDLDFDGAHTFDGVAEGSHTVRGYMASADHAQIGQAVEVSFTVDTSVDPISVALTAPADGAQFTAPATIPLEATATGASGVPIARVEFYRGTEKLGEDATAPYQFSWTGVAAGAYTLTARAIDEQSRSADSPAVQVTVVAPDPDPDPDPDPGENRAPVLAPIGDKTVANGATLAFTVTATDPDDDTVTLSVQQLPTGAAFDPATGRFEWVAQRGLAPTWQATFTASDGTLSDTETITITVTGGGDPDPNPDPEPGDNRAPRVAAGPGQTIATRATAQLAGQATDDGLPNPPGALTVRWNLRRGPGTAFLDNAASLQTGVAFSEPGVYVLQLTANDGQLSASDDLTVTVGRTRPSPRPLRLIFRAAPHRVRRGQPAMLFWFAPGAERCDASGDWAGAKRAFGFSRVRPTDTSTYTLTCSRGQDEATDSVTVTVDAHRRGPPRRSDWAMRPRERLHDHE
jgi:PKD repeat protein